MNIQHSIFIKHYFSILFMMNGGDAPQFVLQGIFVSAQKVVGVNFIKSAKEVI